MNLDECLSSIKQIVAKDKPSFILFLDVENASDYIKAKGTLETFCQVQRVSDRCNEDTWLDLNSLSHDLEKVHGLTLLLGLSYYLMLRGKQEAVNFCQNTKTMVVKDGHLIILTFQMSDVFNEVIKIDSNPLWYNRIFLAAGDKAVKPRVTFLTYSADPVPMSDICPSFKAFLREQEDVYSAEAKSFISTAMPKFQHPSIPLRYVDSPFAVIKMMDISFPSVLLQSMGTEKQWKWLLEQIQQVGSFSGYIQVQYGSYPVETLLRHWQQSDGDNRWLLFLALKIKPLDAPYLKKAVQQANTVADLPKLVYSAILDTHHGDKSFTGLYQERKALLPFFKDNTLLAGFCKASAIKQQDKIWYLTSATPMEKTEIIKCLADYSYSEHELRTILPIVYPELDAYLSDCPFDTPLPFLNDYFKKYKLQKVLNRIEPSFLELVNEQAGKREYNLFPMRDGIFAAWYRTKEPADVYWVDALGVEFLGFIMRRCRDLNLMAKVEIGRTALPTITSTNKQFLNDIPYKKVQELDDLKHAGVEYNYQQSKLPLHLIKELEILDNLLIKIQQELLMGDKKRALIVSDHGASRLVVLSEKQYSFDVDSKGTHGGRCCAYVEGMPQVEFATEENGYYVLASYDRFKGGMPARVETHGGATLEEVVVPIIELTLKDTLVEVRLHENTITVSYRQKATLTLFVTPALANLFLKVNGKTYKIDAVENKPNFYRVELADIKQSGKYSADVLSGNNVVASDLSFFIKKAIGSDNVLL